MHSTFSDGTFTPTELVERAEKLGLRAMAVTDHDGTGGVREAQEAGKAAGIFVESGIEIGSVIWDRSELHILGYGIDIDNEQLQRNLEDMKEYRNERNRKLLAFFQEQGIPIEREDLLQHPGQTYIGKPNFAIALIRKGYAKTVPEVFASPKLLAHPTAARLKQKKVETKEAIRWIREAGGRAVLAHPMKTRGIGEKGSEEFFEGIEAILDDCMEAGLEGLECFHPSATDEQSMRLLEIAAERSLIVTRGTDFHGLR